MNFVIAILSLVPIFLVGDLIHQALAPKARDGRNVTYRWTKAFAFGIGAAALVVFYVSLISTRHAYGSAIVLFSVISLLYLAFIIFRGFSGNRMLANPTKAVLMFVLVTLLLAILWYVSGQAGLGFDGYAHWGIKAKGGFLDGGWTLTREGLRRFAHSSYPLLVPSSQAWTYTFMGEVNEGAVKVVFVMFYLGLGALFYEAVRQLFSKLLAFLFTLLMMSTPLLALSALAAYADIPLMFFLFGSVWLLTRWLDSRRRENLLLGAMFAGLMLLVKQEALVYWVVIFAFLVGFYLFSRRSGQDVVTTKQMILFPLVAILIAGSWFLLLQIVGVNPGSFEAPSLTLLVSRSDRLMVIAESLMRELFLNIGAWGILWYLFALTTVWKWRRLAMPSTMLLWISVVMPILLLSISFVFSIWEDYTLHIDTALSRLILHTVPLSWLFIARQSAELQTWYRELRYGAESDPELGPINSHP